MVSTPRLVLPDTGATSIVVAFVEIAKAPKLLGSLGQIPRDIVPMPIGSLSMLCRRGKDAPAALSGVVVCVPEADLPSTEQKILVELGRLIPVFRICEDSRDAGLSFFDRCRQVVPRVPRFVDRLDYRKPVFVARDGGDGIQRLLLSENVSLGGIFLRDPVVQCGPDDVLHLRFPGLVEVPELVGRVRWVRDAAKPGLPPGYGCAFDGPAELAARRLLSAVRSLEEEEGRPALPPPRRLPKKPQRR